MEYSYKFRLCPNAAQRNLIQRTFGCARFVYNHFLSERITQYRETGKSPTRFQQDKELTQLKKSVEWLKEVDATALQSSLQSLDAAYQNFFRRVKSGEKPGFPRFKSKHDHRKATRAKPLEQTSKYWTVRSNCRNSAKSNAVSAERLRAESCLLRYHKIRAANTSYRSAALTLRSSFCRRPVL